MAANYIFSRAALREMDRRAQADYGIPVMVLMENAGRAVSERVLLHRKGKARVLVIVGAGNNGGDGLVAARWLNNSGVDVTVLLIQPRAKFSEAAAAQLQTVERMGIPVETISPDHAELRDWVVEGEPGDVIVDALFGTGLSRRVDGVAADVIRAINASGRWVVAIDTPSGLDTDTGQPLGISVAASETVSFSGGKPGFPKAAAYTGKVIAADIGIPRSLLKELAVQP